jgi:hypothetical protein
VLGNSALGEFALGQEDLGIGPPPVEACSTVYIGEQACSNVEIVSALCPTVVVVSDCGC